MSNFLQPKGKAIAIDQKDGTGRDRCRNGACSACVVVIPLLCRCTVLVPKTRGTTIIVARQNAPLLEQLGQSLNTHTVIMACILLVFSMNQWVVLIVMRFLLVPDVLLLILCFQTTVEWQY